MDFLQELYRSIGGYLYRDYVLRQARFLEWAQNGFTEDRLRTLLTTPINDEAHDFIKNFEMPKPIRMVQSLEELETFVKAASFQDCQNALFFIKYLQMIITSKCQCRKDNFDVENVIQTVMKARKR